MVNFTCRNCTHFHQHYTLNAHYATPIDCGHCTYPRLKKRKPDTPVCSHFLQRTEPDALPNREAVLHFLTVDAIKRIFELALPPEIAPAPDPDTDKK